MSIQFNCLKNIFTTVNYINPQFPQFSQQTSANHLRIVA